MIRPDRFMLIAPEQRTAYAWSRKPLGMFERAVHMHAIAKSVPNEVRRQHLSFFARHERILDTVHEKNLAMVVVGSRERVAFLTLPIRTNGITVTPTRHFDAFIDIQNASKAVEETMDNISGNMPVALVQPFPPSGESLAKVRIYPLRQDEVLHPFAWGCLQELTPALQHREERILSWLKRSASVSQ